MLFGYGLTYSPFFYIFSRLRKVLYRPSAEWNNNEPIESQI